MRDLVVYGVGELGTLLGGAALRRGIRVTPLTRASSPAQVLAGLAPRTPLLVSVGERDLASALDSLPEGQRDALILLQNELFPGLWQARSLTPSVLVPWFMQKRGLPTQALRASPIFGEQADLLAELLDALALPHARISTREALAQALVDKYAFILTINALGLAVDRTLGTWLQEDPALVWDICSEAIQLGQALVEAAVEPTLAQQATREGMLALSNVPARGRSARERVTRALSHAARLKLSVPTLARVAGA